MKRDFIALCVTIVVGLSLFTGCGSQSYLQDASQETESLDDLEQLDTESKESQEICVQISGAVQKPGVYTVPDGSRVYEVVKKAGGLRDDASERELNQARVLTDGESIYVSTTEEAQSVATDVGDDRININTATAEELTSLPGIGETRAQTIVEYRESNGLFSIPEDLKNVSGIGDSTYSKLASAIKVN